MFFRDFNAIRHFFLTILHFLLYIKSFYDEIGRHGRLKIFCFLKLAGSSPAKSTFLGINFFLFR